MSNNEIYFIQEFNNLCRKDNRIKSWVIYVYDNIYLRIDVNFIDYNNQKYDYHKLVHRGYIEGVPKKAVQDMVLYSFEDMQSAFLGQVLVETKDEEITGVKND